MDRNRQVRKTLIFVLLLNWLVALAKLILGYLINSVSMIADGFHSFGDGTSNIVGLIGIHVSSRPIDKNHPYGHKKYETFAAIVIAMLLFVICFNVLRGSFQRISNPVIPKVNIYSFLVMAVTLTINIVVMRYEYRKGKRLKSDILVSDSRHTRSDIFTSCAVIIALIAAKTGLRFIDPIGSIIIAGFIAHSGIEILRETSRVLCDAAMVDIKRIEKIVKSIDGIVSCHKIRTRGRPDDIHIDLHVLVDSKMHMDAAHKLSYRIEDEIKKQIPGVVDVVVHMEPFTIRDTK